MKIFFIAGYTWDIWSAIAKRLRELWYIVIWISWRIETKYRYWVIKKIILKYKNENLVPVLINCIGCWIYWRFLELTDDDFKKSFECNFLIPIQIIQTFSKVVLDILPNKENKKYIINVNSQAALKPFWYWWAYNSMKTALSMSLKVFEKEYKQYWFKIKEVFPPVIKTKMLEKMPYLPKEDKVINLDDFIDDFLKEILKY